MGDTIDTRRPALATPRARGARLQAGDTGFDARALEASAPRPPSRAVLRAIYRALLAAYGEQQWWPTASEDGPAQRFEICIGAILVQNTSWRGAAAALANLADADALSCEAIRALPEDVLADLVRPSGHFRVKARKLKTFCDTLAEDHGGDIDALLSAGPEGDATEVRVRLLAIWGIGPETADAMTLYAARLPTFVVDAYAYRLFERLGIPPGPRRYDVYRDFFLERIGPDVWALNEWHALIVRHGQQICRKTLPRCEDCVLLGRCAYGQATVG